MRAGGDRGLHGRLAPARERADGRDQHVAALHERAHRVGPLDVGDRPLQAAELLGQRAHARLVARGQHGPRSTIDQGAGGEVAGVAGGAEDDDALCHSAATLRRLRGGTPRRARARSPILAGHGRARPRRAPDHLRHRHERGSARGRRLRQGLAGVARAEGRRPRPRRAAGHPGRGRAAPTGRRSCFHGHLDVVPAREGQFTPRVEGDRLIGRGAYDMKGALAAMMCALKDVAAQDQVRVRFVCVPDEESEDVTRRSTDVLVKEGLHGRLRAHRRADRPAHRRPGQGRARGAPADLAAPPPTARPRGWATTRSSRPTTPSGASRRCPSAASPPTSSTARRSTSRGSSAATRSTRSPTVCTIDVDIRFLPNQDPGDIMTQIRAIGGPRDRQVLHARAGHRLAPQPLRAGAARRGRALDRGRRAVDRPRRRLGRDLVPGGRHPRGRVRPRRRRPSRSARVGLDLLAGALSPGALGDFVKHLPAWLERQEQPALRAVDGGLA